MFCTSVSIGELWFFLEISIIPEDIREKACHLRVECRGKLFPALQFLGMISGVWDLLSVVHSVTLAARQELSKYGPRFEAVRIGKLSPAAARSSSVGRQVVESSS
jgi:hypothetical protein